MAITIKKTNGLSALQKLGFSVHALGDLEKHGISVKLTPTEFVLFTPSSPTSPGYGAAVPVKLDDLMKLNAGTLPEEKKVELAGHIQNAIGILYKHLKAGAAKDADDQKMELIKASFKNFAMVGDVVPSMVGFDLGVLEEQVVTGALNMLPKVEHKEVAPIAPKPVAVKWPEFPENQKKTAPPIKLRDATMMYQPVHGTSASSRYFLVAANADLRVAVRIQNATLSVRIEGKGWEKYKDKMTAAGFGKLSSKKEYSSMHLEVGPDKVMMSKTLGAVLLGLGIPMETPLPDILKIPGYW